MYATRMNDMVEDDNNVDDLENESGVTFNKARNEQNKPIISGASDSENELHSDPLDTAVKKDSETKTVNNPFLKSVDNRNKDKQSMGAFFSQNNKDSANFVKSLDSHHDSMNSDMNRQDSLSNVVLSPGVSSDDIDFFNTKSGRRSRNNSEPIHEPTTNTTSSEDEDMGLLRKEPPVQYRKSNSVPGDKKQKGTLANKFKHIASFATLTKWWQSNVDQKVRKKKEKIEERKMRMKLQYHFMTPFEKYKLGRKPWKLGVQILKILIVTTQVILFGSDRFASVAFIKNTHTSFRYLFLQNFDGNLDFSIYTREQLVQNIHHISNTYLNMSDMAIGRYWYLTKPPAPVILCEVVYRLQNESRIIDYQVAPMTVCQQVTKSSNFSKMITDEKYFDRVVGMKLKFHLNGVYLNAVILGHKPECMSLNITIQIDNSKHDGRLRTGLRIKEKLLQDCRDHNYTITTDEDLTVQDILIAFDVLVITICLISLVLCLRSVIKSIILAQKAEQYFQEYRHEKLTKWDLVELINKWFPVIALSDLLSITGSIYKIYVDRRDISYYNVTSVFLGVGVILVWIGLLRFFTYFKEYNTLLITLRAAAPSLLRFMFCAMFMFFGFTFCGWIVLGAYHEKFSKFLTTAECLYSLVNGDDMYPTFSGMPHRNVTIWVFSKLYLYIFISLFIYLVLSTFISIVGDSYERLKDYGRMPPTRIERFISGRKEPKRKSHKTGCPRCEREKGVGRHTSGGSGDDSDDGAFPHAGALLTRRTYTNSQLSLVSASLE